MLCLANPAGSFGFCQWLRKGGVDLTQLDPSFEGNYRDARFKAIIPVDPGFATSFSEASLKAVNVAVQFINQGTPASIPGVVDAHYMSEIIPGARLARVPDAVHFSFLGICKPKGVQILQEMADDPVCTDAGGRDRAALHADMIGVISGFLSETLPAR